MKKKNQKIISSKTGSFILFSLAIIVIFIYSYFADIERNSNFYDIIKINIPKINITDKDKGIDVLNAPYLIDGKKIKLINGQYENSDGNIKILGNILITDLDSDKVEDDAVLILVKNFNDTSSYYIAGSIKGEGGYEGTDVVLLEGFSSVNKMTYENGLIKLDCNIGEKNEILQFKIENNKIVKI
jgi:hypothetical protein